MSNRERLRDLFYQRPMPDDQLLVNLGLDMRAPALANVLWIDELPARLCRLLLSWHPAPKARAVPERATAAC
jgi:hypothetical protein